MKKLALSLSLLTASALPAPAMAYNPFSPSAAATPPTQARPELPLPAPSAPKKPENIEQQVPSTLLGEVDGMAVYRGSSGYVFQRLNGRKIIKNPVVTQDGAGDAGSLPPLPPIPGTKSGVPLTPSTGLPPPRITPDWKQVVPAPSR